MNKKRLFVSKSLSECIKDKLNRSMQMESFNKLSLNHTIMSKLTSGSAKRSQKQDDKNIFVYKIIHDLRAPTESLISGLKAMVEELAFEYLRNDSSIYIDEQTKMKYTCHRRVHRALIFLDRATNDLRSQHYELPSPSRKSMKL